MGIILLLGVHMNKKEEKYFRVKIYELDNIRELNIDLNNSKDRSKLKHILLHEPYRIRKKDLIYYKEVLEKTKIKFN